MDDVQLENGYTTIANEILEQIAKIKLSPTQYRLIFIIWRYTYGFKRKEHELSLAFLSEATGCDKRQIQRELKELSDRKIIYQLINIGKNRVIGFNKHYSEWTDSVPEKEITIGETAIGEIAIGQTTNSTIGETVKGAIGETTNQEINNIKQNLKQIYSAAEIEILDYWNSKNVVKHNQTKDLQKIIQMALKNLREKR